MLAVKLTEENITMAIDAALEVLKKGGIIAYPTETFYGLGARADIEASLKRLYALKKRPEEKAMSVIIGNQSLLKKIIPAEYEIPPVVKALMDRFWPGPLTLLLPAEKGLSEYLTGGNEKIAVRIPGESFALQLAKKACFPITATSVNISGMPPAENADMVREYFEGGIDLLIDGGQTAGGLPSTIIDASEGMIKLIRKGVITCDKIARTCGVVINEQR